ncbi:MAG: hypothetical protein MUF47_04570 [Porphyrobacter sp.]|nr:hypothetical protein [Porphyrobacter sp.]
MSSDNSSKAQYTTPAIKEYGSVSDLVGTILGGPGMADGMGMGYNS